MSRKLLIAASAAALVAACQAQPTTKDVMAQTVDPQAQIVWLASGTVTDLNGVVERRPTTEEGWKAAEDAATRLAETGRLLAASPYSDGRNEDWVLFANGLTEMAEKNRKGLIDRLSDDELLVLGGELYSVCEACHLAYPPPDPQPE